MLPELEGGRGVEVNAGRGWEDIRGEEEAGTAEEGSGSVSRTATGRAGGGETGLSIWVDPLAMTGRGMPRIKGGAEGLRTTWALAGGLEGAVVAVVLVPDFLGTPLPVAYISSVAERWIENRIQRGSGNDTWSLTPVAMRSSAVAFIIRSIGIGNARIASSSSRFLRDAVSYFAKISIVAER